MVRVIYINKIMFVVSSTAQADMFSKLVVDINFLNYDITVINSDKWIYKEDIESRLNHQNLANKTIEKFGNSYIKKLLLEYNPKIVILGHDQTPMGRLFVKNANLLNIPTLWVQDGILGSTREIENARMTLLDKLNYFQSIPFRLVRFFLQQNQLSWNQKIELIFIDIYEKIWGEPVNPGHGKCRYMAVFGEATKNLLVSEGIDPQRIIVTGNPKFDCIYNYMGKDCKLKVCTKWNISLKKNIILLITEYFVEAGQWSFQQRSNFVLTICRAVSAFPNVQLIIKLHPPIENEVDYYEIIKDLPNVPILCKYSNLQELINSSVIIMTVHSTVALEAMAMKKPVIIVNLFNSKAPLFYRDSGALFATNEQEIKNSIEKALFDAKDKDIRAKRTHSFVNYHAYLQDGQSSRRIGELIKSMIKN